MPVYADDILQQREVISDRIVERWCYPNGNEVPADNVPEIRRTSETSGVIETASYPLVDLSRTKPKVELRRFREVTFIPEVRRRATGPIATTLSIPALPDHRDPGWAPVAVYNPVLVLDRLDKMEAPASEFEPDHVIELIPIQDDEIGFTTSDEDAA